MNVISCVIGNISKLQYSRHSHDCWEIVYHVSGDIDTLIDDKIYKIVPGDVFVTPPFMEHEGISKNGFKDIALTAESIDFDGVVIAHDHNGEILKLIEMLDRVLTQQEGDYKPVADVLLETICRYIKYNQGLTGGYVSVKNVKNEIYDNISNAYFDLAGSILSTGFDKDHFRRCFKKETGKTPLEYLTSLRLTRARHLLERQEFFGIEEVAHNCGFADSLYFSTCFKKHMGLSPLQYRKKYLLESRE